MNCLKLVMSICCLTGTTVGSQYEPGTLHSRVRRELALEIAKRKKVLPHVPCSKVRSTLERYGKEAFDRAYCPPLRRLFLKSGDVPLKFAAIVPVIAPILGLWVVGKAGYGEYIQERGKLVEFRYEVERLLHYIKPKKKTGELNKIAEKATWFLEEGYEQAHEHLMDVFCDMLEEQYNKYHDEVGRKLLEAYGKKEHEQRG